MISTTSEVLDPTGSHWLTRVSSDSAVTTEVMASSSGMPAATSAPNTSSSSTRVMGTEVSSALRKPWPSRELMARPKLASPPSAMRKPGWRAATAATARWAGATAVAWSATGPGTWKVIRALRPSAETRAWLPAASGDRMSVAARGSRARTLPTSLTACRMAGSVARVRPAPRAWISTSSVAGELTPSRCRTCSA